MGLLSLALWNSYSVYRNSEKLTISHLTYVLSEFRTISLTWCGAGPPIGSAWGMVWSCHFQIFARWVVRYGVRGWFVSGWHTRKGVKHNFGSGLFLEVTLNPNHICRNTLTLALPALWSFSSISQLRGPTQKLVSPRATISLTRLPPGHRSPPKRDPKTLHLESQRLPWITCQNL